jgi:RHS repeat-associated protein
MGVTTYAFDGDGNLLTTLAPGNQATTNTWDGEDRLTKVALPSGIVDSFTYNGDGQRVQKQDSTGTTNHVWDGQNILLETNASNILQVVYTLEPALYGKLISQSRSNVGVSYLFDALGTARQLTNNSGVVTDSYLYDSFGNRLAATGTTVNPYRFVGRFGYYFDPDSVSYWVRARYYNPSTVRFLSLDPVTMAIQSRSSAYWYSSNNPVNLIDPSGWDSYINNLICECCCLFNALTRNDILWKYEKVSRHNDWQGNAITHCVIACDLVEQCGFSCALWYWDGRESSPPGNAELMDLSNNLQGYGCGLGNQNCLSCCTDKMKKGLLTCIDSTRSRVTCPPPPQCWLDQSCRLKGDPP